VDYHCRSASRLLLRVPTRAFETEEWVTVEKLVSLFLVARTGRTLCMGSSDYVWCLCDPLTSLAHSCYSSFRVSVQRGFVRPNSGKEPAFSRWLTRLGFLCARCRSGLFTPANLGVKSELAIIVARAFKRIEEITQKKVFATNTINTSNPESSLEKEPLTKVGEKIGISEPTLSKAFESREE